MVFVQIFFYGYIGIRKQARNAKILIGIASLFLMFCWQKNLFFGERFRKDLPVEFPCRLWKIGQDTVFGIIENPVRIE